MITLDTKGGHQIVTAAINISTGKIFNATNSSLWNFAKRIDDTVFDNLPYLIIQIGREIFSQK